MKRLLLLTVIFLSGCGETVLEITHEQRPWESETYAPKTVEANVTYLFCPDTSSEVPNEGVPNNIVIKVEPWSAQSYKYVIANEYDSMVKNFAPAWNPPYETVARTFEQSSRMGLSDAFSKAYEGEGGDAHAQTCLEGDNIKRIDYKTNHKLYRDTLYFSINSEMEIKTLKDEDMRPNVLPYDSWEDPEKWRNIIKNNSDSCADVKKRREYTEKEIRTFTYCIEIPDKESFEAELSLAKQSAIKRAEAHLKSKRVDAINVR